MWQMEPFSSIFVKPKFAYFDVLNVFNVSNLTVQTLQMYEG